MDTDKIALDKLKILCKPEIDSLIQRIEGAARDRGIPLPDGLIEDILWGAVEDIHIKKFIANKIRKVRKWVRKKLTWKNLFG